MCKKEKLIEKKIYLTQKITTGRRYIHKKNLYGEVFLNYDLFTPQLLFESLGIDYISDKEASYWLYTILNGHEKEYGFVNGLFSTIESATKLLECLNDFRFTENNKFKGLINANYAKLLKDYIKKLKDIEKKDYIEVLNSIINNSKTFVQYKDATCYVLDDMEIRPLEEMAFKKMFKSVEYLQIDKNLTPNIEGIYSCYGIHGEILNALKIIEDKKLPIGDCEIIYTQDVYENLLRGDIEARGLKCVKTAHAKSTNVITFAYDILNYVKEDYKYELLETVLKSKGIKNPLSDSSLLTEYYKTMQYSDIIVGFGYERTQKLVDELKSDANKKGIRAFLGDVLDVFQKDKPFDFDAFIQFVRRYIGGNKEDNLIKKKLKVLGGYINSIDNKEQRIEALQKELEQLMYTETEDDTKIPSIYIGKINKSFSLKKYLFILGLDQKSMINDIDENPFIENIDLYKGELRTNKYLNISERLRDDIKNKVDFYITHSDGEIYLSFASRNKIEFRPSTISTYLLDLKTRYAIKENKGSDYEIETGEKIITFEGIDNLTTISKISEETNNGDTGKEEESAREDNPEHEEYIPIEDNILAVEDEIILSATALEPLIKNCPYQFYYKSILKLPDRTFPKLNEYEWLEAKDKGSLLHEVFEQYVNEKVKKGDYTYDENTYIECFKNVFDKIQNKFPELSDYIKEKEKEEFEEVGRAYIKDTIIGNHFGTERVYYNVLECEYDLKKADYKLNNIKISGKVDRVDGYVDEKNTLHLRIIDYKSGGKIGDDLSKKEYIQHVIYPLAIIEGNNKKQFDLNYKQIQLDEFIYSYVMLGREYVVDNVKYTNDRNFVMEKINKLFTSYKANDFYNKLEGLYSEAKKIDCKYCNFKDICIKKLLGDK